MKPICLMNVTLFSCYYYLLLLYIFLNCFIMKKNVFSARALEALKELEGNHYVSNSEYVCVPSLCPSGVWTYSYGITCVHNGVRLTSVNCAPDDIRLKQFMTNDVVGCHDVFYEKVEEFVLSVDCRLNVEVLPHQFDALVLHAYNCGFSDTLYKMINTCKNPEDIAYWWQTHYTTGNGKALKGLKLRRYFEADLFRFGWEYVQSIEFYRKKIYKKRSE